VFKSCLPCQPLKSPRISNKPQYGMHLPLRKFYLDSSRMPVAGALHISPIRCGVAPPLTPWLRVLDLSLAGRFIVGREGRGKPSTEQG
jgi:hypothetical protein